MRNAIVPAALVGLMILTAARTACGAGFADVIEAVQPRVVKIYGAGGIRSLEAYQSGFLISSEGHVLTIWSYVLDTDLITCTLDDGRRFEAKLVGANPRLEIAVLKIDGKNLPHFDLQQAVPLRPGRRVLAFSNLFGVATGDEPASVQHGMVSAVSPLNARRGAFKSSYQGSVYVLDAITNNPGAAGGALTDRRGRLAGILGKELRNALDDTWLNYALPIAELSSAVADIRAGKSAPPDKPAKARPPEQALSLNLLGIALVSDVVAKTPPFIDHIRAGSPAAKAGLKADDLILFVNNRIASSCKVVRTELAAIDRIDPVRLTIQRDQALREVVLKAGD